MTRKALRLIILTLLCFAATTVFASEYFTITLTNGTSFQTRYRPVPAEWDDNVVMINSDRGNWIGLHQDEIVDVTSHVETTGFGYQVNTTTLFVGWSPAEIPELGEDGEPKELDLGEMFPEAAPSNVLNQFVDVPGGGGAIGNQTVDGIYSSN